MPEEKKKQPIIVIKKITVNKGGGHGGSWKVAFADFMTAMMCFFLVMWLVTQPEEVKKQIARYFSGPSVIEQQLNAYGAEITLEKLFSDLTNEPLKAFQAFIEPADLTPDLLTLGNQKVILFQIAHELGDLAKNVEITKDEIRFDIPENTMFQKFSADPSPQFVSIMEKVKQLTIGLENSDVNIKSVIYVRGYPSDKRLETNKIAGARLDLVKNQVESAFEHGSNTLRGDAVVSGQNQPMNSPTGYIRFSLKQKPELPDGTKPREIRGTLGERDRDSDIYDEFVRRMTEANKKKKRQ